jgi:lysozyme
MRVSFLIAGVIATCSAMASEFERPWVSPTAPLILDCYHANGIDWNLLATEPRVVAIIHKATTGSKKIDPQYHARRQEAANRGYLWGSYHLGLHGNPEKQADYYLKHVKPAANELVALDLEDVTSTKYMNAAEAIRFIKRVKQRIGRYPVLYVNSRSARLITEKHQHPVFTNTPLWYANFSGNLDRFPRGLWSSYTLWQFSSEILTQQAIPGTAYDMDVNVFNGTLDDLKAQWPLTKCDFATLPSEEPPVAAGTRLQKVRRQTRGRS